MTADILREKFLAFFNARGHKIVESDSLVPKDDPTVLFTPAGMNQFKKEFMGFDAGYKRAATAQRCLRTDDLEKVGKTSSHHTFFEMLGNFSFGDYFKEEAIAWAWEFLTKELKIPVDKLWVSVYQEDDEAYNIWKDKIKIPPGKIVKLGDKDNFWPAEAKTKGPNGPCGPCSEIFYDFGPTVGCGEKICDPSCPCGRFVEIWNLVFTQFNRKDDGILEPLPNKNIDTGMGLERLVAVMQGKQNNFETELFQPIIKEIKEIIRDFEWSSDDPNKSFSNIKPLVYALADHIRAIIFLIYDGVIPSNEKQGYVVRKLIRKSLVLWELGLSEPFLYKLVPVVAEVMRKPYPALINQREEIAQIILAEEKRFINTLSAREELFQSKFDEFIDKPTPEAVGNIVFLLYDTYGIPLDLTREWLNKHKISFSQKAFEQAMEQQRERSKSSSAMKGDVFVYKEFSNMLKDTEFLGYTTNSTTAKIIMVLNKEYVDIKRAVVGDKVMIILDKTVFYGESGGQVGDTGKIIKNKDIFIVSDTFKLGGVIVHVGEVEKGEFKNDDLVKTEINLERRANISRNHTATHILQAALRQVLGSHVQQQGSLVGEEKFRFDFTHFKGLSEEEISRVEELANNFVSKNQAVSCKEMAFKDAKKAGALAFFEEKYGENVRVVDIGDISKELCGGTHLDNIGQIGIIKIVSEGSVASGIRRIEGVTGAFAESFVKEQQQKSAEESKKQDKLREIKEQEKKRGLELKNKLPEIVSDILGKAVNINGINFVSRLEPGLDMNALRLLADKLKEKLKQGVIAIGSQDEENKRAYLVIGITQDLLTKGLDAGALIRQAAPLIGGSGGGRQDFAQAGGNAPENFTLAFAKIKDIINALNMGQER